MYYTGLRTVFFRLVAARRLKLSWGEDRLEKGRLCFEKTIVVEEDLWFDSFP